MPLKDRIELEIKELLGLRLDLDAEEAPPGTFQRLQNFFPAKPTSIRKAPGVALKGGSGLVTMQLLVGSYEGNGTSQSIALGFEPTFVLLKGEVAQSAVVKSDTMDATASRQLNDGTKLTTSITALTSTGFDVGAHATANDDGVTYYFVAARNSINQMATGTYVGNAADDRDIEDVMNFTPGLLLIIRDDTSEPRWRSNAFTGDSATWFLSGSFSANDIQAFTAGGFQLGSSSGVNASGATYHWIAFREVPGFMKAVTYTGNGADNRNITTLGFEPEFVLIKRNGTSSPAFKFVDLEGDAAFVGITAATPVANHIQDFLSNGFQIGTATPVNSNGQTYQAFAFRGTE